MTKQELIELIESLPEGEVYLFTNVHNNKYMKAQAHKVKLKPDGMNKYFPVSWKDDDSNVVEGIVLE